MRLVIGVIVLLTFGTRCDSKVTQPILQEVTEGQEVNLPCSHEDIATNMNVFWYRQFPNQGPQFLIQTYKTNVTNQMISLTISADRKSSTLSLPPVTLRDNAVYYCIEQSGNRKLTFGIGTVVRIKPNIKDPQPALYQLTSPKSSDTSVCLLTDFDSSNTYTNGNDSTVLEMMTMESKSYGAVAWGSKSSFNCTNAFPQNIINLTQPSGSTCKVQDVEQSFETDKDLNLMNASLIFLRVIFLKTVGFNLLMTLRLWSN